MTTWYRRYGKRGLDVGLASFGLVLFALPMLWFAWAVRNELGRPIFFRQIRIGTGGKSFTILKFRTMTPDKRIGTSGHWLRRTAMDELPQLFNILRGQMSFVGPRPLIPEDLDQLKAFPGGERRFSVRPGLAGLAQIRGPKVPTLGQRLRWDLTYVDRCSLGLDLKILLGSVGVTLRGAWEGSSPSPEGGA